MTSLLNHIERLRFLILGTLLLLVPVLVDLQITVGAGPETKFRLLEFGVFLAALFSLPLWCARKIHLRFNLATITIAVWIAYTLIRAAVDTHRAFALDMALRPVSWLLFILLTADACATRKDLTKIVWIAAAGQLGPVILAVGNIFGEFIFLQWIKGENWIWHNDLIGAERGIIWSSLGQANYYASYAGMLLIWLFTLLFVSRRWWSRLLFAGYSLVVLITLAYTFTRGIWASLIPTFFLILILLAIRQIKLRYTLSGFIQTYGKRAAMIVAAFTILLTAVFMMESNKGPLHNTARRFQHGLQLRDTSLRSRPLLWYAALRMWREKPVWGQGIGRYAPRYLETVYQSAQETDPQRIQHVTREMNTIRSDQAHNDYLQILAETGMIGYALFLLFLVTFLSLAVRKMLSRENARNQTVVTAGCMAVLVMTSIQGIYDFPLRLPSSALLFALAAAGVLVLTRGHAEKESTVPAFIRWGVSLALAPLLVSGCLFVLMHLIASHNLDKGSKFLANGIGDLSNSRQNNAALNFQQAEKYVQRANRLYPGCGAILFDLGRIYASQARLTLDPRLRRRAIDHIVRASETWCVPESYSMLGRLYLDDSQYALAEKMSDTLLVIDPEREDANFLAAQVDIQSRKYEDAARHLRREIRLYPDNIKAIAMLGSIEQNQFGNPGEAAVHYQKCLDLNPRSLDIHEALADVQIQLGEYGLAREHYQSALEGSRALSLRDFEIRIQNKLSNLDTLTQEKGDSNES